MTEDFYPGLPARLVEHLLTWVGDWPPRDPPALVVNPRNAEPGWDGSARLVTGVVDPGGRAVIGVAPTLAAAVDELAAGRAGLDAVRDAIPTLLGTPEQAVYRATYRWSAAPTASPDVGAWFDAADDRVPAWLLPFGGEVLMAIDHEGRYLAGVGIKRHDDAGHEIAVVTEEAARGKGLARRLVAQAARRILDEGAVPTYQHAPGNAASARVADAAGFPDLGWGSLSLASTTTSRERTAGE